jgi:hypothetical protein
VPVIRDENGRNFSHTIPFRFLHFPVFPYLRDPVFVFTEVENGVFRSFSSNPF